MIYLPKKTTPTPVKKGYFERKELCEFLNGLKTLPSQQLYLPFPYQFALYIDREIFKPATTGYTLVLPPGHGKSTLAMLVVAWLIGAYPGIRLGWARGITQGAMRIESELLELLDTDFYRNQFPGVSGTGCINQNKSGDAFAFSNQSSLVSFWTLAGVPPKESIDFLVMDDPVGKPQDAENSGYMERVMQWNGNCGESLAAGAKTLIISGRWGMRDFIGRYHFENYEGMPIEKSWIMEQQERPWEDGWKVHEYSILRILDGEVLFEKLIPWSKIEKIHETVSPEDWRIRYMLDVEIVAKQKS